MKAAEVAETRTGVAIGSLDFKKPAMHGDAVLPKGATL